MVISTGLLSDKMRTKPLGKAGPSCYAGARGEPSEGLRVAWLVRNRGVRERKRATIYRVVPCTQQASRASYSTYQVKSIIGRSLGKSYIKPSPRDYDSNVKRLTCALRTICPF